MHIKYRQTVDLKEALILQLNALKKDKDTKEKKRKEKARNNHNERARKSIYYYHLGCWQRNGATHSEIGANKTNARSLPPTTKRCSTNRGPFNQRARMYNARLSLVAWHGMAMAPRPILNTLRLVLGAAQFRDASRRWPRARERESEKARKTPE